MTEKKGFVLYFDAASSLAALCAAQRGELLLALFDYAERTAKQPLSPETALASYPALDEQTRMAFRFMANIVAIFLAVPYWKGKYFSKPAAKKANKEGAKNA